MTAKQMSAQEVNKNLKLLNKIIKMFAPCDRDFLKYKKEDVIKGPNDRAMFGFDTYFPKEWLIEDYGFTEEQATDFVNMVRKGKERGRSK